MRRRLLFLALAAVGLVHPPTAGAEPAKPTLSADVLIWTQATEVTFSFSSDAGASFLCQLDGPAIGGTDCVSPQFYTGLFEGPHSFHVRAVNGSGESSPSNFDWTIDLTPPALPGDSVAEATSPAGAIVSFNAVDNLDPLPQLACTLGSGSTFPLGPTQVDCTAVDAAGNPASGTITVTVQDTTPPVLAPPADVVVTKQSPAGAVVEYELPDALDAADPSPAVECAPAAGSLFPVGSTTVTCTATDAAGLTSEPVGFDVIVQEGPVPATPSLTANLPPLTRSRTAEFSFTVDPDTSVDCRLDGPSGTGVFTACESATGQSYSGLADGAYLFTLRVTNGIGNVSEATYEWTVDGTPPAPVVGFSARGWDQWVDLGWRTPADVDFRRVRIWRERVGSARLKLVAERRTADSYADRDVRNEVRYRYVIRSFDKAGNRSPAAEALARPSAVFSPEYDALVRRPPLVDWRSVRNASYYNMQLWRNGKKLLSVWPLRSRYRLRSSWSSLGRRHSLARGRYTVYVWPGFGSKAAVDYGPLLGSTSFRVG